MSSNVGYKQATCALEVGGTPIPTVAVDGKLAGYCVCRGVDEAT
ncbi:MAG: hypothetical protein SCH71_16435 [Desulfobulbaceae bacterium]|nr:hypothetical protein [Desulfobulbaceae bacterium]